MMAFPKRSAALMLALALSVPAHAAKPKTWKVNLKDADINALVSEVAEVTGKSFVVDPRVKGTITVISSKALSASELYELFLGVLSVNSFAAVPSGNTIKIVPDVNAKQFGVPVDVNLSSKGEALVTRVIRLENTSAVDMVPILRPMMPQFAHLAAVAGANALVLSDHANNIEALTQIVAQLDADLEQPAMVRVLRRDEDRRRVRGNQRGPCRGSRDEPHERQHEHGEDARLPRDDQAGEAGTLPPNYPLPYITWDEWSETSAHHRVLALGGDQDLDHPDPLSTAFVPPPRFGGQLKPVLDHVMQARTMGDTTVVVTRQAQRLAELWAEREHYHAPLMDVVESPEEHGVVLTGRIPGRLLDVFQPYAVQSTGMVVERR